MGLGQSPWRDHLIPDKTEEAFVEYESVRHVLPPARQALRMPEYLESLADIAARIDVFLLDAFGVLNIGEKAIPGAPDRVADLMAVGKRVMVVSNAASMRKEALVRKYQNLGYHFEVDDVVSSRDALIAGLQGQDDLHWGVMAVDGDDLSDLGNLRLTILGDDIAAFEAVDGFLMIGSASWTEARQTLLETALAKDPRPVLVGNPDIVAPRETHFSPEPGHYAHRSSKSVGVAPEYYGKPFQGIYDLVFAKLGAVDTSRVVMVGDTLHTDILGAHAAAISSALIASYGFFAGSDVPGAIAKSGISPTYVLERP